MKRYGKQRSSKVVWDEANLNFLEANKSPKRKITEPKTPYHAPEGTMNNAEHAQAIWNALSEVASSSGQGSSECGSEEEEDEVDQSVNCDYDCTGLGQSGRRLSFADKRKAHYDEFRKSKSLREEDLDADEDLGDAAQKSQVQDMVIDGIGSVNIQDHAPQSGMPHTNTPNPPRSS